MEHEVFVPVEAQRLREVLGDPARVARAVPGLQHDAGAEPVTGRLKVRIGGSSITYRGSVRVSARDDGSYAVEGEGTESRGTGSVKLALTLGLRDTDDGSALTFDGSASADGRVTELPPEAVRTAVIRLLNRFAENLAAESGRPEQPELASEPAEPSKAAAAPDAPEESGPAALESLATGDFAPLGAGEFEAAPDADDAPAPPPARPAEAARAAENTEDDGNGGAPETPSPGRASVFDIEVPPSALDPLADEDDEDDGADAEDGGSGGNREGGVPPVGRDFAESPEPPAEAAHARRTMIGRSTEEVDHAPPRGRYAPVPAPLTVSTRPPLRWAAPAAALVVASAIVVGRVLRRRR